MLIRLLDRGLTLETASQENPLHMVHVLRVITRMNAVRGLGMYVVPRVTTMDVLFVLMGLAARYLEKSIATDVILVPKRLTEKGFTATTSVPEKALRLLLALKFVTRLNAARRFTMVKA
jgi:hypothetical protein